MGRIEYNRVAPALHNRQSAQVADGRIIPKGSTPLAEQKAGVPGSAQFSGNVLHIPGGQELTLFDVHGAAGLRGGNQQVGLAREKGGNLEHIHNFRHLAALLGQVHIGQDGQAGLRLDFGEYVDGLVQA